MSSYEQPAALMDLPPSAKLVFTVLAHEGELTQQEITNEAFLSSRTARYALKRLAEIDAIEKDIDLSDARQRRYRVSNTPESV